MDRWIRMPLRWRFARAWLVIAAGLCGPAPAEAQNYPARTITLVVPGPAGGGTDILGRALAQAMAKSMGQTIIIENKPGAS